MGRYEGGVIQTVFMVSKKYLSISLPISDQHQKSDGGRDVVSNVLRYYAINSAITGIYDEVPTGNQKSVDFSHVIISPR
jgi:hypothetical protein